MVYESIVNCVGRTPLISLRRLFPRPGVEVIAKLEFFNPGGSMKDRPARFIIEQGLRDGTIGSGTHLVESSSGNLGIALAMISRVYGLTFTCVVDPKITSSNLRILQSLGARIEMVSEPDNQGGYLQSRIRRVHELLEAIPGSLWINQYANPRNWQAHYYGTGTEILSDLDRPIDLLVAAVSTTGTIMGISRRLRQVFPRLRVVAVDAVGSVIFGASPGPRELPGIGASRVPELLRPDEIDEVVYVSDRESTQGCQSLAAHEGILAGGSSGSVIAAIGKLLPSLPPASRVLTLLPDRGERYLDLVYDNGWIRKLPACEAKPVLSLPGGGSARPEQNEPDREIKLLSL
ncbi:2,3-diaminopropionate biosynthesis protein SbnA [Candidatus Manganitrophus noduliformans]|uniref:N-(2-amino-2-carboxyethyl)-L-glutamate synthase n=1 Tax=Candidatus Manganitrophus noduliformans TaxID=2606439 RepID=A0A7X6DUN2_9BACT|nr:2,3-diaminopropionate biosynthesis protein SbnA [Candidatus Manganitrophus noduliformans]NKE73552.1 2,3-diaminopropionate biosynthesis protein SbnA [Candidatus Manganitrophus noduliformans]